MENNPLKQYFRRPAVYVTLPSKGADYDSNVIDMPENGELPVYPMTAIDEITARTPDALFNGVAVVELIKSCVPNILDPWSISSNDLDAILISIRAAGGNDSLDITSKCPSCQEESSYGVNLMAVLNTIESGDYSKILESGDLKIKFKPLRYKQMNDAALEQFAVQKHFTRLSSLENDEERATESQSILKQVTLVTMDLIAKSIEYIETPQVMVTEEDFIIDFLRKCDRDVYAEIRDYNAILKNSTQLKPLDVTCIHCNHAYPQPYTINPSDFFG